MLLPQPTRRWMKKRRMLRFYSRYIKPGDLCFDIGANRGERSAVFLQLGAVTVAVEPLARYCTQLSQQYAGQPFTIVNAAVADVAGTAALMICDQYDECSTLSEDFKVNYADGNKLTWTNTTKVAAVTLGGLQQQYGTPAYCKIDVEGMEWRVLKGMGAPIPFIEFEYNYKMKQEAIGCIQLLQQRGNYLFNFTPYEQMEPVQEQWVSANELISRFDAWVKPAVLTGEILARLQ